MDDVVILVAVRLKSKRLPRKALADLNGKPLIISLTERVRQARIPSDVVWCTSIHSQDDPLEELAVEHDISCYRGSELDVMSRFVEVARERNASTVVRVTGDNPLTDPAMMDFMIEEHLAQKAEYTYTEDLPVGTRPEIIDVGMLERCHELLQDPDSSEYMTWMLNRPDYFRTLKVNAPIPATIRPEIFLTVDTEEDLKAIRSIYGKFHGEPPELQKIISWLDLALELRKTSDYPHNSKRLRAVNCKIKGD